MTLIPKGCKRCGGDLYLERDQLGDWYLTCLQCSASWFIRNLKNKKRRRRSLVPAAQGAR